MCIITDSNNIIVSISFIRGIDFIPDCYNVYEYVNYPENLCVGDIYST